MLKFVFLEFPCRLEGLVAKYVYVYKCIDRSAKPVRFKTIEYKIKLKIGDWSSCHGINIVLALMF